MVKERRSEERERKRRRGGTQRCAGRVAEEGWKVEEGMGYPLGGKEG